MDKVQQQGSRKCNTFLEHEIFQHSPDYTRK